MKSKVTSEEACLVSWNAATFRGKEIINVTANQKPEQPS